MNCAIGDVILWTHQCAATSPEYASTSFECQCCCRWSAFFHFNRFSLSPFCPQWLTAGWAIITRSTDAADTLFIETMWRLCSVTHFRITHTDSEPFHQSSHSSSAIQNECFSRFSFASIEIIRNKHELICLSAIYMIFRTTKCVEKQKLNAIIIRESQSSPFNSLVAQFQR